MCLVATILDSTALDYAESLYCLDFFRPPRIEYKVGCSQIFGVLLWGWTISIRRQLQVGKSYFCGPTIGIQC